MVEVGAMPDSSRWENLRAAREALGSVAASPTSTIASVASALRRYLGAEQYREQAPKMDRPRRSPDRPEHD